ncbi:MAG: sodium:proton antiporter NhaD [Armatimonadetes bacterium]|nr:sodium:proton antiporter NhaD [Armatimonadota bacterium]
MLQSRIVSAIAALCLLFLVANAAHAGEQVGTGSVSLTGHWAGIACLLIFILAYILVMGEEFLHLRKSKPMLVAAGLIWVLIGLAYARLGDSHTAEAAVRHNLLEYAELFLFLLAAMTYVNTMEERQVFDALRAWLVARRLSLRAMFWITGLLAFLISPIADNLTTALIMGAVTMAVGAGKPRFMAIACVNVVVAANAGGAFSPFGDITTLMVWQAGLVSFGGFFALFVPSLVNWLVPAFIMSLAIEKGKSQSSTERIVMQPGALVVVGLFIATITMAVCFRNFLHLPPVIGMMTGLGILKFYGFFQNYLFNRNRPSAPPEGLLAEFEEAPAPKAEPFDIFKLLQKTEWDTLMFFYGVILCVGGLATLGYLAGVSDLLYTGLGPTAANIFVGILSAVIDNIPVMFAVISMNPDMSHAQWLLVTLTAGVGGSLLSIGSAAGVALMGQARGVYTFMSHLKWAWAIALGYAASIGLHLWINGGK